MIIRWPDTLPCPQFGLTYALGDPQLRAPIEDGYEIYRRRFTAVPVEFPVTFKMLSEQAVEFEQFYKEAVADGTLWFVMRLAAPQNIGDYYVRFIGPYSFKKTGQDLWEYTASMEMYLRPGSYALPPTEDPEP